MYSSILNMIASASPSPSELAAVTTITTSSGSSSDSTTSTTPSMVKIISQETIKPSSPTPHHLKTYKLSFLDHIAPPIYVPFILFYEATDDDHSHYLKKSLAETLTGFYPLAGKMKRSHEGFLSIDCTDDGVEYLEARVNAQLHETIKNPHGYLLDQFLPHNPYQPIFRIPGSEPCPESKPLLAVQVNTFDCGGLAVVFSMSHEVGDTTTLISFIQAWAAKAQGDGSGTKPVDPPLIEYESLFPPRALPDFPIGFFRDNIVTKRIVFDSSKISALREKVIPAMNDGSKLTRVEAVSAFIWKRFMNINREKVRSGSYYTESLKFLCVGHAVNVRKRINLPQNSFGNLFFPFLMQMFTIDDGSTEKEYDCFVSQYRDMIRKIDEDYIRELQTSGEDGEYLKYAGKVGEDLYGGELETLNFTSWCRMGYYEIDFGWGKPVWVSPGTIGVKDLVLLMDTKSGDGIEVWANMIPEDIDALERDQEFVAFVS